MTVEDMQKRHMHIWGRAARMARPYIELKQPGCDTDDSALQAAKEALLAELVILIHLSQELDIHGPMWRKGNIYMTGAKAMLASCGVSMQEVDAYRVRSVDGDASVSIVLMVFDDRKGE